MNEINKNEYSILNCKGCKKECKRYRAGKYPNNKDVRYVDDAGKEFCGRLCPECHKAKVAQRKRLNKNLSDAVKELSNESK